jgi:dipeptidyl aminopeptidase/acylaminoacyl peptidase
MKHILLASALLASAAAPALARDLTIQDVATLSRVGAPAVSPDGKWLVWQQRETDLAANRGRYDLWRLDLSRMGAIPEKIAGEADVNETNPQIVGDMLYFASDKGGDDAVWAMPLAGGAARKLTDFSGGFGGFKVSPAADKLLI